MGLKPGPQMLTWALKDALLVVVGGNKTTYRQAGRIMEGSAEGTRLHLKPIHNGRTGGSERNTHKLMRSQEKKTWQEEGNKTGYSNQRWI